MWLILGVAAGLRLLGAWIGNLNYDESMIIARAEAIDLRPDSLRLVWQTVNHPLWLFRVLSGRRSQIEFPTVEVDGVDEVLLIAETARRGLDPLNP